MHSLAIALKERAPGHRSDDAIFDPSLTQLQKAEICPEQMGWYPKKINKNLDAVIVGMHAKKDNPELLAAQNGGATFFLPRIDCPLYQNKTR